jgi:glycosyltransferase involved in cell wall biosynthesis
VAGIDVVLPVLNEVEAIPWVLGRMPADHRPIVVDNGSSDGSAELAERLGAHVVREPARGFGAACFAGLATSGSDVVAFMDCDGSLDPRELPRVTTPVSSAAADLALGARNAEPGAWPAHARVANRALAFEARRRGAGRLRDIGPMRAARRLDLLELELRDRRFGWPLEMLLRAVQAGWRIEEVDVGYRPRRGRSKVTGSLRGTARAVRDMAVALR